MEKLLEDKLHAIAVQLGRINEFLVWLREMIEAERKKEAAETRGGTK